MGIGIDEWDAHAQAYATHSERICGAYANALLDAVAPTGANSGPVTFLSRPCHLPLEVPLALPAQLPESAGPCRGLSRRGLRQNEAPERC